MRKTRLMLAALALASACAGGGRPAGAPPSVLSDTALPPIQREMRGVWVATVANIDWPSKTGLPADRQRAELVSIMDRAAALGLNTIVFQVRPASDAVYRSALEPWASLLSGVQGTDPGFDPLELAVDLAHARGMQLHAWINPFRAGNSKDSTVLAGNHMFFKHRDRVRVYGTQLWLDPGDPEVHDHVMRVVTDIVRRYDVDAVHADDYFYPYPQADSAKVNIPFPDSATYARYGNGMALDDWRRANVDRFIERLGREVHAIKPSVLVGISPFGIWRPGNPPSVAGFDAYAAIYADSRKWLQQGWVDYLAPQLYWAIAAPQQGYPALLDWWVAQRTLPRHLWPGLAAYRVGDGSAKQLGPTEMADQIGITRARPGASGHIFFNGTVTLRHGGVVPASLAPLYALGALVPASPWLDAVAPVRPTLSVVERSLQLTPGAGETPRWWSVRMRAAGTWSAHTLFGTQRTLALPADVRRIVVNAVDQAGNASEDAEWRR